MVLFSDFAGWLFGMLLEIGLLQIQLIVVTTVTELGWMKQKNRVVPSTIVCWLIFPF